MRKLLLVGLVGCWSTSPKPASEPRPGAGSAHAGGAAYGGAAYGRPAYGSAAYGGAAYAGAGADDPDDPDGSGGWGTAAALAEGQGAAPPTGQGGAPPTVTIGNPGQTVPLDRAIIHRYIKRNIRSIQYCYEKELVANPSLGGRADLRFTIGGNGSVVQATGSGMPPVDACVAQVIAAIQFPAPQGGGAVVVNYPFIFRPPPP